MHEVVAEALVVRALLLTASGGQGSADLTPRIAALLDDSALAGLTAHEVLLAVVAVGRAVLSCWVKRFPQLGGPLEAIAAAEAWAAAPSAEAAESAVRASEPAMQQACAQGPGQLQHATWAGRTAAWVAMAPKLDWPAVAALFGACQAVGRPRVIAAVAETLARPCVAHAAPGAAPERGR
jgi:hypothetical protein